MTSALKVDNLSTSYREKLVLSQVSFELPQGEIMGIVGPNGAGKSTLVKAILNLIPKITGEVQLLGKPLGQVRKQIGYMPQQKDVDWDFPATVYDVVKMGLYAKTGWFGRFTKEYLDDVKQAMELTGVTDLHKRQIGQLSGGQKQRSFLARTLAGKPDLIFMDEPFAGVDIASEKEIIKIMNGLKEQGKTVVVVHHDLATVSQFCSYLLLLNKEVVAFGPVAETFKAELIHKVYGLDKIDKEIVKTWAL